MPALWAAKPSKPVGYSGPADLRQAVLSGNFEDAIWEKVYRDPKDQPAKQKPSKSNAPKENEAGVLGRDNVTVTISRPVKLVGWAHNGNGTATWWNPGGAMELTTFYGQRGPKRTGTFNLNGGSLTINSVMMLAGLMFSDSGTGVFNHTAGTLSITDFALCLTGPFSLSNSTVVTGIYNFSGGTINITSERVLSVSGASGCGIVTGVGKGQFNWTGGVLNTRKLSEDLVNNGGRLSPGGEGVIGTTMLDGANSATYTQKALGILSVDIAGETKFDRLIMTGKNGATGTVVFESGAKIAVNLPDRYKPPRGRKFSVVRANRIEVRGTLEFIGEAGKDFSYEIIERDGAQELRLESTPGNGGVRLSGEKK